MHEITGWEYVLICVLQVIEHVIALSAIALLLALFASHA